MSTRRVSSGRWRGFRRGSRAGNADGARLTGWGYPAVGITVAMLGLECMVIDKAILAQSGNQTALASNKEWVSPEWAPWTLLSGGIIVVLYSFVTVHQHHPRPQGGAAGTNERHARRRGAAA